MKKHLIILSLFVLSLLSCETESQNPFQIPEDAVIFDIDINSQELYTLDIGQKGIEDRIYIIRQAIQFERSELITNNQSVVSYLFQSKPAFTGTETVVIKNCISAGDADCAKEIFIALNLTVN